MKRGESNEEARVPNMVDILDEKAVSLDKNYVLQMCGTSTGKVGIALSDSTCEVYSYDEVSLKKLTKLNEEVNGICDIKFSPQNDSLLYIGSADGSIKLWDLREGNSCSVVYEENPETRECVKPLISFDVSCNDRVLCGGSELVDVDSFMLFWDVRCKSLLGGYWNSHTDDIVQINFSKDKPNKLVSGGVDGLINVFDISEQTEDDALQYSLSTDCAVDKISWLSENVISCITQNIDVQIWDIESADQLKILKREDIAKALNNTNADDCYIVDIYNTKSNVYTLLTGSYANEGKNLNTIEIVDDDLRLKSNLNGNKQIVRCSWYDREKEMIVSGGEMGILSLWKTVDGNRNENAENKSNSLINKMKKIKLLKNKPYLKNQ